MALVQKLMASAMHGRIKISVEYDDLTLAITRCVVDNSLTRNERPTATVKDDTRRDAEMQKGLAAVAVKPGMFMEKDPEDGVPLAPFEIGLNVPFGSD